MSYILLLLICKSENMKNNVRQTVTCLADMPGACIKRTSPDSALNFVLVYSKYSSFEIHTAMSPKRAETVSIMKPRII